MSTTAEQTTVARPVSTKGIGLHTGAECAVALLPAEPDAGIVFVSSTGVEVPATGEYVAGTDRCTTLAVGDARIGSVEHLLAALYADGVDNVRIEVEGPEVPTRDGSAREWLELLRRAGRERLGVGRRAIALRQAVWAGEGQSWAAALPARRLSVGVGVDYEGTVVGRQTLWLPVTRQRFAAEVAPARTFALTNEIEALRAAGLALGGGEGNAFAVGPEGYSGSLRFADEVVRHKTLDLIGDLALCGWRLAAAVIAVRPSHRTNVELVRAVRAAASSATANRVRGEERVR
jgi:UDP-3-O-acyl N-acetylglucosamine deacetylase